MPTWPTQKESCERRWYWEEKAREVEDGHCLPIDAESWAAEYQLPPFVQPFEDPAAVFDWDAHRTDIPLSLAVMWVAWRDRARAGWAWERYRIWGRKIYAEAADPDQDASYRDAELKFWEALRQADIQGAGIPHGGDRHELIPSIKWLNARSFHDGLSGMVGPSEAEWIFGQVIVPKAVVFDVWEPLVSRGTPGRKNRQNAYRSEATRMRAVGFKGSLLRPLMKWAEEVLPAEERLRENSLQTRLSQWKI